MRKILALLLSLLIISSSVLYVSLDVADSIVNSVVAGEVGVEYVEEINARFIREPIYALVPKQHQDKVIETVDKIENDPKIKSFYEGQITNVIDDLVNGKDAFNQSDITDEVFGIIDNFSDELESVTQGKITSKELRQEYEKRIVDYDIKAYYDKVITKDQSKVSPSQMRLLRRANAILDSKEILKGLSISVFLVGTLYLASKSTRTLLITSLINMAVIAIYLALIDKVVARVLTRTGLPLKQLIIDKSIFNIVTLAIVVQFLISFILIVRKSRTS